jgi:peptide deformylase
MENLTLLIYPHPTLRAKASPISPIDQEDLHLANSLCRMMLERDMLGLSAPMFGFSRRLIVVNDKKGSEDICYKMLNPEILKKSQEKQDFEEWSPCYPGISASIPRFQEICVRYQEINGTYQEIEAQGLFSSVIQHQLDYLEGRSFLDYLSPLKKQLLLKKIQQVRKKIEQHTHVHGPHCSHA